MKEKDKEKNAISRREFLKGAGLVVGGAAAGGGLTYITMQPPEEAGTSGGGGAGSGTVAGPSGAPPQAGDIKTVLKPSVFIGLMSVSPMAVDVQNNKVLRLRPHHWDAKYPAEAMRPWKIEARGGVFEPPLKTLPNYLGLCYKTRTYSPNRILYPLKRVDWDPKGERHPENRGKSKYVRISWDEAATLIADELKRVKESYGPLSIMHAGDGHGESKIIHAAHGCPEPLFNAFCGKGNYSKVVRNPDSWEGWWWGSKHVWGEGAMGLMAPVTNCLKDVAENTQMLLNWGSDLNTTYPTFADYITARQQNFWNEIGIKMVFICPDLNFSACVHADKWIPILPNTDSAFHLAISYVWITEGTYDKEYVATHTVGFEKYSDHVLGKDDGIPKTPEWASAITGVPEWTIKALARQWAKNVTSTTHYCGGPYVRGPYSHEVARMESINLGMQGLGKPGVHQFAWDQGYPMPERMSSATPAARGLSAAGTLPRQHFPKTLLPKAIGNKNLPLKWYSTTSFEAPASDQFVEYQYPIADGGTEIHLIWLDAPCWTTNWNDGEAFIDAYRHEQIETLIVQHPWLENDTLYADIILPTNTFLETSDVNSGGSTYHAFYLADQAIPPIGESKSDYEAVVEVAKKLGLEDEVTGGKTVEEWRQFAWERSGVADLVTWDDLQKNGYYVLPTKEGWQNTPPGLRLFYEDPVANPLSTPSGKLEFSSDAIAQNFPDDQERPPYPHWIAESDTHQESLSSKRAEQYPLLVISNHPRWREHSMHDDVPWLREIPTCKVKGFDGYMYEPVWIHPETAKSRGIKHGDIVKLYNERGTVLGGAYVTERLIPGAVYMDHGARCDHITDKLDRGGAINLITPLNTSSKNAAGMVCSGFLVEVEKVKLAEMEEWMQQYPEAFQREYDPACGLMFNNWIIKEA